MPARCPWHYGYTIAGVATLAKCMTAPGQSICIGVVIDALIVALPISRTAITSLYLVGTTASACLLPSVGRAVDRWGPRRAIGLAAAGLGGACMLLASASSRPVLLLAFFLLRFFGQGSMNLVAQTTINLWWVQRRGTVMSVGRSIMNLALLFAFPVAMHRLQAAHGWRNMYRLLGLAELALMLPLGLLLFRGAPELYGMLPDGRRRAAPVSGEGSEGGRGTPTAAGGADADAADAADAVGVVDAPDPAALEHNWTKAQALRTLTFWSIAGGVFTNSLVVTALFFHLHSVLVEGGLGTEAARAPMYLVMAVSTVASTLFVGWLVDRGARANVLLAVSLGCTGVCCVLFALPAWLGQTLSPAVLLLVGALQGVGGGLSATTDATTYANYFGRRELGAITGVANSLSVLGSAFGPLPFGVVKDATGSYAWAFVGAACMCLVAALAALLRGGKPGAPPTTTTEGVAIAIKTIAGKEEAVV